MWLNVTKPTNYSISMMLHVWCTYWLHDINALARAPKFKKTENEPRGHIYLITGLGAPRSTSSSNIIAFKSNDIWTWYLNLIFEASRNNILRPSSIRRLNIYITNHSVSVVEFVAPKIYVRILSVELVWSDVTVPIVRQEYVEGVLMDSEGTTLQTVSTSTGRNYVSYCRY